MARTVIIVLPAPATPLPRSPINAKSNWYAVGYLGRNIRAADIFPLIGLAQEW
jgi:hypothetical protein